MRLAWLLKALLTRMRLSLVLCRVASARLGRGLALAVHSSCWLDGVASVKRMVLVVTVLMGLDGLVRVVGSMLSSYALMLAGRLMADLVLI